MIGRAILVRVEGRLPKRGSRASTCQRCMASAPDRPSKAWQAKITSDACRSPQGKPTSANAAWWVTESTFVDPGQRVLRLIALAQPWTQPGGSKTYILVTVGRIEASW